MGEKVQKSTMIFRDFCGDNEVRKKKKERSKKGDRKNLGFCEEIWSFVRIGNELDDYYEFRPAFRPIRSKKSFQWRS